MITTLRTHAVQLWIRFRRLPGFVQLLIAVPVGSAIVMMATVGNMGLAFLGGAVALPALLVGWVGGLVGLLLAKAGLIIANDNLRKR